MYHLLHSTMHLGFTGIVFCSMFPVSSGRNKRKKTMETESSTGFQNGVLDTTVTGLRCVLHFDVSQLILGTEYYDENGHQRFRLRLKSQSYPEYFGQDAALRPLPHPPLVDPLSAVLQIHGDLFHHDHNYVSLSEPPEEMTTEIQPEALEPIEEDDGTPEVLHEKGRSRITKYGVEPEFIPNLEPETGDSDLVTFLKQKVVHQQQMIRQLQITNQKAEIILGAVFSTDQLKSLGMSHL